MSTAFSNNNGEGSDRRLSNHEEEVQRTKDDGLYDAVCRGDVAGVQQALQSGANVHCFSEKNFARPLLSALLDADADARWRNSNRAGSSVIYKACSTGHLSIVEMLLNHDNGLLENTDESGWTPLLTAIEYRQFFIAHFLLDRGANALATYGEGWTTLTIASTKGVLP